MLMRTYYPYKKSPKTELKLCPKEYGVIKKAIQSLWNTSYKVSALGRLTHKCIVYLNHLTMLTEDPDIKSVDEQKIKGGILRWHDSKRLLESAFFHALFQPTTINFYARYYIEGEVCLWYILQVSIIKTLIIRINCR